MLYFLSQGSNIGDRALYLREAIRHISAFGSTVAISSVYESEPWGFESEDWFWNMVWCIDSGLEPEELLIKILKVEEKLGRIRKEGKGYHSRTIDIDILSAEHLIYHSSVLKLPHPRLSDRKFVLMPWAEIAPHYMVPAFEKSVTQLLAICPDQSICRKLEDV